MQKVAPQREDRLSGTFSNMESSMIKRCGLVHGLNKIQLEVSALFTSACIRADCIIIICVILLPAASLCLMCMCNVIRQEQVHE